MPDAHVRLLLADDHPIVLQGLQQLFERRGGFDVVRCCQTAEEAIAAARQHPVDVILLDLSMPGSGGIGVLRAIGAERLPPRVVILTAAVRDEDVAEILRLGASGLVMKDADPDELIECVQRVHAGEQWIDRAVLTRAYARARHAESAAREAQATLTARELEIVRLVSQGLRNRDIAQSLSISEGTVKIHLHNVYKKVGVDGRLELLLYVQERGWT